MKTRILAIALFLCSLISFAQTQKELETSITQMYNNTVNGNYDALLESTYPKLYELFPKEQVGQMLKGMMNGDGYRMLIVDTPPNFKYGGIKKIGEGTYCLVTHDMKMKMIFDEKMDKEGVDIMIDTFKQAMQTDEITYAEADNSFTIKKTADVIAIADKLTNNKWYFLNRTSSQLMSKILSPEVIKGLNL